MGVDAPSVQGEHAGMVIGAYTLVECIGEGGFGAVWRSSDLFTELREPQSAGACASCGSYDACQGGCMATKFFTGLPLDGPDPECVKGHGEEALAGTAVAVVPTNGDAKDHSWSPVRLGRKPMAVPSA